MCQVIVLVLSLCMAASAVAAPPGSTSLVSRPDGTGPVPPASDNSSDTSTGAVSRDGRYALFTSRADGFADGVDPRVTNLFVRDTVTDTTTLVSRSDGLEGAGANADSFAGDLAVAQIGGQPHVLVAFATTATNIVDHATGTVVSTPNVPQVWLRDVTSGRTTLISRADGATGTPANASSEDPAIAVGTSGPVVAFRSEASNLDGTGSGGVYIRRVNFEDTQLVSCKNNTCAGTPAAARAADPDVTTVPAASGTYCPAPQHVECIAIAFLVGDMTMTNDPARSQHVMFAVVEPGKPTTFFIASRPNAPSTALANNHSFAPAWSGDGSALAFLSRSSNLTADALPAGNPEQAFVRLPNTGATTLVSRAASAANSRIYSIDLGGTAGNLRAVFYTDATNLGGTGREAYVRELATSTTQILNRASGPSGVVGDRGVSDPPVINPTGTAALVTSSATNLGDDSGARFGRVRLRRLDTPGQEVLLVSRPSGVGPLRRLTDTAFPADVSADGRFVAFTSNSPSLPGADANAGFNVYVRDLLLGRTDLVSRATGATGAPSTHASGGGISADGRKVVFSATNLTPDSPPDVGQVYLRDLDAQTTTLLSRRTGAGGEPATLFAGAPRISDDGARVVFVTRSGLDPAADDGFQHVYVRDIPAQATVLVDRADGPNGAVAPVFAQEPDISGDGRRVAWDSTAAYAGAPADGKLHVFVRDLPTSTTMLVSRADGTAGASAAADSRAPSLNADGSVAAFASRAQNLGETFVNPQVFVRDIARGQTLAVSRATGAGPLAGSAGAPAVDAAGTRVAFHASGALTADGQTPGSPQAVYTRDLLTGQTTLVSRAAGLAGEPADGDSLSPVITPSGDCVAFQSTSTNLDPAFSSPDFPAVYLRVLRGECPPPAPPAPITPAPVADGQGAGTPTGTGAGTPQAPPTAGTSRPPVAAKLARLKLGSTRFRTRGRKPGTTITFTLDRASAVTLTFSRFVPGRVRGKRCVAAGRSGKRCTATRTAGRLTVKGRKGTNRVRFTGRLGRKRLAVGRYRLSAKPSGGATRTVRFRVVR